MDEVAQFKGLIRLTAPNPGPMTHTGTQTYIVGRENVAIIDPGPDDAGHLRAILAAVPKRAEVSHIFVTHAHRDHCGLATRLAERLGLEVLAGLSPSYDPHRHPANEGVDDDFDPRYLLDHGAEFFGKGWHLVALDTPGHLQGHFSFAWPEQSVIFSGDHVMGWASTFISPPHGSVADYRASLDLLVARSEMHYFPGHGPSIADGPARARALKEHRQMREDQIVAALKAGPSNAAVLTAEIYAETPVQMHPAAERNVLAHLLDLEARGLAAGDGDAPEMATYRLLR